MVESINHDELDAALKRCGANWDAGQAHGLLCSRLAILGADAGIGWLDQVLEGSDPDNALRRECEVMLDTVYAHTHRQLSERQSEFEPLLPGDADSTIIRAEGVARWCEGFLHGLVSGSPDDSLRAHLAAEPLSDIIKDMLQITRATVDEDSDNEANETAYAELVEYLRVAVQLIYEELADFRSAPAGSEAIH
jgi:yecA family protein